MSTQVLALSVVCDGGEEEASAKLPPISEILSGICPKLNPKLVVGNKAFLDIPDCEVFEDFYKNCIEERKRLRVKLPALSITFYLALASGAGYDQAKTIAHELLNVVFKKAEITDGVVSYITDVVYTQLPPKYRDNYHSSIEVESIKAHRRFSEEGLDCFVVSPIGIEETGIRERADFVFEHYIKPACESTNYRARRSDQIISRTISAEMKKRLEESPMVVVYLGSPRYGGWNPNLCEFGYREHSNKPIVVLKDGTANGEPYDLSFDISDYRCIDLPPEDKHESNEDYGRRVRTIRDSIVEQWPDEWRHPYPSATFEVSGGRAIIIKKSGELEQLFDVTQVLRKNLHSDILPHLYTCMPQEQVAAFQNEQNMLIGIVTGAYEGVHATVPMLFNKPPTLRNRAFLPVIVSYSYTNVLRLNVIYVEVTGALKKHTDGYFYCDLVGQPIPEQPADENVISMKA